MLSDELKELKRRERHKTNAETRYWCDQYRLFAERAVAVAAVPDEVIEMADRFMRIAHIYNGMKRSTAERFLDCLGYPDLPIGWESLTLPRLLVILAASQPAGGEKC